LTRADARLLERHAEKLWEGCPRRFEWQSLEAAREKRRGGSWKSFAAAETYYYPIEISPSALAACAKELGQIDLVSIVGHEQPYLEGLRTVAEGRGEQDHLLVLFLGSTIGNFDRDAGEDFLWEMRAILRPGDALLLGTDLEKSVGAAIAGVRRSGGSDGCVQSESAGADEPGAGADFDLSCFRHEARWNSAERRIEMHLRSNCRQTVQIPAANLRLMLDEDETIWTESSHKYKIEEIPGMAERAGFRCDAQWIDEEWPFAQNLLVAK